MQHKSLLLFVNKKVIGKIAELCSICGGDHRNPPNYTSNNSIPRNNPYCKGYFTKLLIKRQPTGLPF